MTGHLGRQHPGSDQLVATAGTLDVVHRLALAVQPVDGLTRRSAAGARVGREVRGPVGRSGLSARGAGLERLVIRHGPSVGAAVRVRVDDPDGRWVPRRFEVALWTLAEVQACDPAPERPVAAGPIDPRSRVLRPWLLPGSGYAVARRTTGARFAVRRPGTTVRWPRVEAFDAGGVRIGWAHGDARGEVLLLVPAVNVRVPSGSASPQARVPIALRTHWPDPSLQTGDAARRRALDPLYDLPVEPVLRSASPPQPGDLDNDVIRGLATPAGYLTSAQDVVVTLTVGEVHVAPDITIT